MITTKGSVCRAFTTTAHEYVRCARVVPAKTAALQEWARLIRKESGVAVRAPAFPDDAQWLNVARPLRPEDLRGRLLLLHFWTFA